jgi:2-oxoglutarate ferredoxin oxidoreductase subunit beta
MDQGVLGLILSKMRAPELPVPLGVFYQHDENSYDQDFQQQIDDVTAKKGEGSMKDLILSGDTWDIK